MVGFGGRGLPEGGAPGIVPRLLSGRRAGMSVSKRASILAAFALALAGCGPEGGGRSAAPPPGGGPVLAPGSIPEIEPNDSAATATPLPLTTGGVGSVFVA